MLIGLGLALATAAVVLWRRPAAPKASLLLAGAGLLLLVLAAGAPTWRRPLQQPIEVLVDLSPSTRTASYRQRAFLERRIHQLVGHSRYHVSYFPGGATFDQLERLPDIPIERTLLPRLARQGPTLLFSDCRFDFPSYAPPLYIVVDTGMEAPADASVQRLELRGEELTAAVHNTGEPRTLSFSGTQAGTPTTVPTGTITISQPLDRRASAASAQVSPGDAWPENDALTILRPPTREEVVWWVGERQISGPFTVLSPAQLSTEPADYLNAAAIVLDNVPAAALSETQLQRLTQYVRDLGGTLFIVGGDHAFGAGGYAGTALESLAPLASTPPQPTTHWILLTDASGSMSGETAGSSRWGYAIDAIARLIPHLPPEDLIGVAGFSDDVKWWISGKPVKDAARLSLPPADVFPHGPTNLEPALENVAAAATSPLPKQLLLLTDTDAPLTHPQHIAGMLKSHNIQLHVLALGEGQALQALRSISAATGGTFTTQLDPKKWADVTRKLMQAAAPDAIVRKPVQVVFSDRSLALPPRRVELWNRTWLKTGATALADASFDGERLTMAAKWNVGDGAVLAAAFSCSPTEADALLRSSRPPRDPHYRITWDPGARLHLIVDAGDESGYLNDRSLTLHLYGIEADPNENVSHAIEQTGPGRYELVLPAPRTPVVAVVREGDHLLDRRALAGRYAPEFNEIGNDRETMRELARRTGGMIVPPSQTTPIDFHWPARQVRLTSWLALLAGVLIAAGLVVWKRTDG